MLFLGAAGLQVRKSRFVFHVPCSSCRSLVSACSCERHSFASLSQHCASPRIERSSIVSIDTRRQRDAAGRWTTLTVFFHTRVEGWVFSIASLFGFSHFSRKTCVGWLSGVVLTTGVARREDGRVPHLLRQRQVRLCPAAPGLARYREGTHMKGITREG